MAKNVADVAAVGGREGEELIMSDHNKALFKRTLEEVLQQLGVAPTAGRAGTPAP